MTKVQLQFKVENALDTQSLSRLGNTSAVYGILALKLSPALDQLTVEYDATRLKESDVEAVLARAGIRIQPK